jgi:hypothetical protein
MFMVKQRILIICTLVFIIAIGAFAVGKRDPLRSSERGAWKAQAIGAISARVADPAWPGRELVELKKKGPGDSDSSEGWLSGQLIVMRNGDWLAYSNICRKEPGHIYDLFLARGSDGKWYYSTYHFCIGMIVLRMEDQSESLAGFAKTYFLRPFDGHSDECLQKTWPVNSR